jgi:hypothetical protein
MPRNVTVTFEGGGTHVYQNVPDQVPPDFIEARASSEFKRKVTALDGGKGKQAEIDPLKQSTKDALTGIGTGERMLIGAGKAVDDAALGLKGIFTNLTPEEQDRAKRGRALTEESTAATVGNIAGNLAMTAAPAIRGAQALTPAIASVLPKAVAPTVATGMTGAGIGAVANPVLEGESRSGNAALSGALSVGGDLAARGLARVAQPIMQSESVKKLLGEGVVPTPGQSAGGFVGRIEEKLQSVPLIGDLIKRSKDRAAEELNVAAIKRALPVNSKGAITQSGRESITEANRIISEGYEDVLGRITLKPDGQFMRSVVTVRNDPGLGLPAAQQKQLTDIVQGNILNRLKNGEMPGDLAKRADSILGSLASRYRSSGDADQRALGMAIRDVQGAYRELLQRNAGPADAEILKGLNANYANLLRVERAASYVGSETGKFSPAQLQSAVRALDPSKNKRAFAQGKATMQDLSDPAKAVLGSTVPNSGTVDRAMIAYLLGGGGAGANEYFGGPEYLTALGLSPLLYSRGGSRYMAGNLPGQQAISEGLRGLAPYLAQGARAVGESK